MTATIIRTLELVERRSGSAFLLAGVLILTSLVVPVGFNALTEQSWIAGLALVGLAVMTVAVGLFGLYPKVNNDTPKVALAGVGAATIAGVAALGLIVLIGFKLVDGFVFADPTRIFALLGLSMAGGFALGLLLFGVAIQQTEAHSRSVGKLLLIGGVALLAPVIIEFIGQIYGVSTPPWVLFPIMVGVALDTVMIGYRL